MNKIDAKKLKRAILKNFIKLIESRPGLKDDPDIKDAYNNMKNKLQEVKSNARQK